MSNPQYDYWYNRERENLERYQLNEEEWERELQRIYSEMFDNVQLQINNFWSRYSAQEGININVAKQRVNEFDVEAYSRNVAQIIRTQPLSPQALSELRLYNATMRVNRLEMLKSTIGAELLPHFDNVDRLFHDKLTTRVTQEMRRQAGLLGRTIASNAMDARSIVGASFRNATFSQRIWGQNNRLRNELSNILNSALIQGRHPREFAGRLRDMFGHDAINDSLRLLRTEMARVQTEAQKLSFERNGFKQYVFLAIDDDATCEACMSLDGRVFNVADMQVGSNAPPVHPFADAPPLPIEVKPTLIDGHRNSKAMFLAVLERIQTIYKINSGIMYITELVAWIRKSMPGANQTMSSISQQFISLNRSMLWL